MSRPHLAPVAVVDAVRSPFARSFGVFDDETPLSLSVRVVSELVTRNALSLEDVSEVIWGAVVPQIKNGNVARDIISFAGMPKHIPGYTLNRACASSLQSAQNGIDAIRLGRAKVIVAGGVEVLSDVPVTFSDDARRFFMKIGKAKTVGQKLQVLSELKLKYFAPIQPAVAETFTGLTMGQHAEIMAVKNNISRERQDRFTYESHQKAAKAHESGYFKEEIVPVWSGKDKSVVVDRDNLVRADTTIEQLTKLKPAFDKINGTLTAGNSSALTDGAAGVILTSPEYAAEKQLPTLGYIVDTLTVAVDPKDQLLIGPAIAIPKLLHQHGLKVTDVGVYEIHEAFAAQVLSCLDKMEDAEFCKKRCGLDSAFGTVPRDKLNMDGGSIAIGHPFGATGARIIGHALRLAKRTGSRYAVIGICTAGGMGQAMLLSTERW